MSGPRDMRRAGKPYEPPADIEVIAGRRSHYIIDRWGTGWAVTIKRFGKPVETIVCQTPGQVNRERARLASEGLLGFNQEAC